MEKRDCDLNTSPQEEGKRKEEMEFKSGAQWLGREIS